MNKIRIIFEPYPTVPNNRKQIELALDAFGVDYSEWEYAGHIAMSSFDKEFQALEDVHQYFIDANLLHKIPIMSPAFVVHMSEV
tara:strand:- start:200 stop:451 length:252 start_codon:yes stop_codon:yes gene_type:complete